jgi:cell division protein FtsB|nr:MAG TPA: hypothetical protein [Caudoviricetes sp.]
MWKRKLKALVASNADEIEELRKKIEELTIENETLSKNNNDLKESNESLNKVGIEYVTEKMELEKANEALKNLLEKQIAERKEEFNITFSNLVKEMENLQKENESLNSTINRLINNETMPRYIKDCKNDKEIIIKLKNDLNLKNNNDKEVIVKLKNDNDNLKSKLKLKNFEVECNMKEIENLHKENVSLNDTINNLINDETMPKYIKDCKNDKEVIIKLKNDLIKLKNSDNNAVIVKLKNDNANLKSKLKNLEVQCNMKVIEISKKNKEILDSHIRYIKSLQISIKSKNKKMELMGTQIEELLDDLSKMIQKKHIYDQPDKKICAQISQINENYIKSSNSTKAALKRYRQDRESLYDSLMFDEKNIDNLLQCSNIIEDEMANVYVYDSIIEEANTDY